jgi:hypothetical protein
MPVFSELLDREPHRVRTNRYLFFVRSGEPLRREAILGALGKHGAMLDFWSGSLEEISSFDEKKAMLIGLEALVGVRTWARSVNGDEVGVRTAYSEAVEDSKIGVSIVPDVLREALVGSSVVLFAASAKMEQDKIVAILGKLAGVAAFIARMRASESRLSPEYLAYCGRVLKSNQLSFVQYKVKVGDTLSHITRRHYQTPYTILWPLLRATNPRLVNPDVLQIGEILRLPILKDDSRTVQ